MTPTPAPAFSCPTGYSCSPAMTAVDVLILLGTLALVVCLVMVGVAIADWIDRR